MPRCCVLRYSSYTSHMKFVVNSFISPHTPVFSNFNNLTKGNFSFIFHFFLFFYLSLILSVCDYSHQYLCYEFQIDRLIQLISGHDTVKIHFIHLYFFSSLSCRTFFFLLYFCYRILCCLQYVFVTKKTTKSRKLLKIARKTDFLKVLPDF